MCPLKTSAKELRLTVLLQYILLDIATGNFVTIKLELKATLLCAMLYMVTTQAFEGEGLPVNKTAEQLSDSELAHYRKAAEERKRIRKLKLKQRYTDARRITQELATILYRDFSAEKVFLFGSLTKKEFFHANSDIDLAAMGIPPEKFFAAYAALDSSSKGFKVDLLDLKDCRAKPRDIILREGVLL